MNRRDIRARTLERQQARLAAAGAHLRGLEHVRDICTWCIGGVGWRVAVSFASRWGARP